MRCLVALQAVLLVVVNSASPEHFCQGSNSVPVAGIEPIAPELPELAVGHLLGLLDLLWIELNLRGIDGVRAAVSAVGFLVWRLQIAIVVVVLSRLRRCLASGLTVLLSNSALQLIDGTFLQLFAHHFLFAEPGVLRLAGLVHVRRVILRVGRLWMPLRALGSVGLLGVRSRHVKHNVVKLFVGLAWSVDVRRLRLARASCASAAALGLLCLHVDILIVLQRHVFLDEIGNSLA